MTINTVTGYLTHWAQEEPDRVWLRDRKGDEFTEWSWRQAAEEVHAVGTWLEQRFEGQANNIALLSRNRAHWMLADAAINASGNCTVPLFTTQKDDIVKYLLAFTETKALFLGEADNWEKVRAIVPADVEIITFPGVQCAPASYSWEALSDEYRGQKPAHQSKPDELIALTFTSGTTGLPKGVMQTHNSMLIPVNKLLGLGKAIECRDFPRLLSYLPLAHAGERCLVWMPSLLKCGEVTFCESMDTLIRDLADARPTLFLAVPRVWEILSHIVIGIFEGQEALEKGLQEDQEGAILKARGILGFEDLDAAISGGAPISAALLDWYDNLGIHITEMMGMTEANGLLGNVDGRPPVGSVGKPLPGVEIRISEEGEMLVRMNGLSPGYYKMPEETAETFVDGWLHTGDKVRVDENGYYYITGRIKDYFKTIHGKYVAPLPLEQTFSKNPLAQQQCLIGRGFSKTVMVCVLTPEAEGKSPDEIATALKATVTEINNSVEKHARIGVVIVDREPWNIDNGMLTVTMKVKRAEIDKRFAELGERRARAAAQQGKVLVEFV